MKRINDAVDGHTSVTGRGRGAGLQNAHVFVLVCS